MLYISVCYAEQQTDTPNQNKEEQDGLPAISLKALSDQWLKDVDDFFKKEWNYTMAQPSMTSFD